MKVKKVIVNEMPKYCGECPIEWGNTDDGHRDGCGKNKQQPYGGCRLPDEHCLCEVESEVE